MPGAESSSELSDLRRRNLRRVAHVVRDDPGVHLSEIAARTGLAIGAVSSLVNALVEADVIEDDAGGGGGGRGRPRRTFTLADTHADLVGARVTRTGIAVRAATLAGRVLAERSASSDHAWEIDEAAETLAALTAEALDGHRPPERDPIAVISFPGATLGDDIGASELGWMLLPAGRFLDPLLRTGVAAASIGNDGSLATLAEWRAGAAQGRDNAAVVLLGRGLGGSAIIDGKILRGSRTAPGFGHTPVNPDGPVCVCGLRGCIELYASLEAIARSLGEGEILASRPSADYAAELDRRADAGDAAVLAALDVTRSRLREFSDLLGSLLAPEEVVLTGSSAVLAHWLLADSRGPVGPAMVPGALGPDVALIGAVFAAQDDALDDPQALGSPAVG